MWSGASYPWPGGYECAFQNPRTTTSAQIAPSTNLVPLTRAGPATRLALVVAAEERERSAQQDQQVGLRAAVVDVPEVELDPLRPRQRCAPVDLRPAGDPGLHVEPPALPRVVLLDLVAQRRARPDHRHVAAHD